MATGRLLIQQKQKMTLFQFLGAALLIIGILVLLFIAIYSFAGKYERADDTLAAVGFFFIMLGMSLLFPDMLKSDAKGGYSTMRVAIFMVVSVFVFLCVKIGWSCTALADFKIDSTWGYILTAALGSKAVQSLGENKAFTRGANGSQPKDMSGGQPKPNPSPGPSTSTINAPVHDQNTLSRKPPEGPPSYFNKA